jgi:hypothetical protein
MLQRMVGLFVNEVEWICKEAFVAYFKIIQYLPKWTVETHENTASACCLVRFEAAGINHNTEILLSYWDS